MYGTLEMQHFLDVNLHILCGVANNTSFFFCDNDISCS